MIGLDTSFLVAFEIAEHPRHRAARDFASARRAEGFAIAPQVLAEFCHVTTDPTRFTQPLSMSEAIRAATRWWRAREVTVVDAGKAAGERCLALLEEHELGRKRLLDTMLVATYLESGIHVVATLDGRHFRRFAGAAPIVV